MQSYLQSYSKVNNKEDNISYIINMKQTYFLYKAINGKNKYTIQYINQSTRRLNTLHFGSIHYSDYTINKNDNRKRLYHLRHSADNVNDLSYPGAWSMGLLWNKKTLEKSINDMEKTFNINIINNI